MNPQLNPPFYKLFFIRRGEPPEFPVIDEHSGFPGWVAGRKDWVQSDCEGARDARTVMKSRLRVKGNTSENHKYT